MGLFNNKDILREIIIIFFIGSLPLLIINFNSPDFDVVLFLKTLNPRDEIINYFIFLFLINFFVFWFNKYFLNSVSNAIFLEIHKVTHQIGFMLHGVLRAIAGAMPTELGILIFKHGLPSNLLTLNVLSTLFLYCLILMCCFFSSISYNTEPKKVHFS